MASVEEKESCRYATDQSVLKKVASIAAKWRDSPNMLIPVLHEVQAVAGNGIPMDVAETVSREMGVPLSQIYDVETFYAFYSTKQRGKVLIRLCKSAPCHIKGAQDVLEAFERALGVKAGETTADGAFTLETCECIGACIVAPAALVDETVHGNLCPESVHELISLLRKKV